MTGPAGVPRSGTDVTLITRTNCHLCEPARTTTARVCAAAGVPWAEVNVDSDPELRGEFGDRVPVVLVNGTEFAAFRIDPDELAAAIAAR
jgi:glutaredoxin